MNIPSTLRHHLLPLFVLLLFTVRGISGPTCTSVLYGPSRYATVVNGTFTMTGGNPSYLITGQLFTTQTLYYGPSLHLDVTSGSYPTFSSEWVATAQLSGAQDINYGPGRVANIAANSIATFTGTTAGKYMVIGCLSGPQSLMWHSAGHVESGIPGYVNLKPNGTDTRFANGWLSRGYLNGDPPLTYGTKEFPIDVLHDTEVFFDDEDIFSCFLDHDQSLMYRYNDPEINGLDPYYVDLRGNTRAYLGQDNYGLITGGTLDGTQPLPYDGSWWESSEHELGFVSLLDGSFVSLAGNVQYGTLSSNQQIWYEWVGPGVWLQSGSVVTFYNWRVVSGTSSTSQTLNTATGPADVSTSQFLNFENGWDLVNSQLIFWGYYLDE